jgi:hypothetical protein
MRKRGLILLAALLGQIVASDAATAAYYTCDSPTGTFGTGWSSQNQLQQNQFEGASANVVYRDGALCSSDATIANASLVWTMVADGSPEPDGWAQSGRIYRKGLPCWQHFAQQVRNKFLYPPHTWIEPGCTTAGSVFHVWQQTIFVGGSLNWAIRSNINTKVLLDSSQETSELGGPWSHIASWTTPFNVSFAGETKHNNSDIPGYSATKSDFSPAGQTPMQVQDFLNDAWYNTCGYVTLAAIVDADPAHRYATDAPSCSNVRTWTK